MNNSNQGTRIAYAITGMDVCTHICSDLASFNHFLVSGTGKHSSQEIFNKEHHGSDINTDLFLQRLVDRVKNLFSNRRDAVSRLDEISLSVIIHNPFDKLGHSVFNDFPSSKISDALNKALDLNLVGVEVIARPFRDVLLHTMTRLEKDKCSLSVLISPFKYTVNEPEKTDFLGFGGLLFSPGNSVAEKYADLVIENVAGKTNNDQSKTLLDGADKGFSNDSEYPHFINASVIRLIGAVLELNHRTRFSLLQEDPDRELLPDQGGFSKIQPWFTSPYDGNRKYILFHDHSKRISIEEPAQCNHHINKSFMNFGHYLLPIPFNEPDNGVKKTKEFISRLSQSEDIKTIVNQSLKELSELKSTEKVLVIFGGSRDDLVRELERAQTAILESMESGKDWQTPNGSYFTPIPLGPAAKISFVYPGAFSTYIGMGSEIFYLFPDLYDMLQSIAADPSSTINESVIFPWNASPGEISGLQEELNSNPIQMITSGVCFSFLFTAIIRDIFQVKPDSAFGYSLGENSMMFAMGIWRQADAMRTSLEVSPIFHSRVSGTQDAIRQYWKMSPIERNQDGGSIWSNYVLMAAPEKVESVLKEEDRVYITHINAPRQVVIGGEKDDCRRVADALKCMHLQAPYHHAIHCPPIASEYDGFLRLHDWPVENKPIIPIFSAAEYAPLEYDTKKIAKSFAKMLTNPIDFPRLVDLAYQDGARIFIELGAGSNCSKWVDAILKTKPHIAVSINNNNISDHVSILRLFARLISHRVSCNLDPFWRFPNGCE